MISSSLFTSSEELSDTESLSFAQMRNVKKLAKKYDNLKINYEQLLEKNRQLEKDYFILLNKYSELKMGREKLLKDLKSVGTNTVKTSEEDIFHIRLVDLDDDADEQDDQGLEDDSGLKSSSPKLNLPDTVDLTYLFKPKNSEAEMKVTNLLNLTKKLQIADQKLKSRKKLKKLTEKLNIIN